MTTYESATADLIAAIDRVVEHWLTTAVERAVVPHREAMADEFVGKLMNEAAEAAREGRLWVVTRLRETLEVDVDQQRVNPLQTLREAVKFPTRVLLRADVPPAARDEFDEKINPDDIYGIGPAHWNDIDESLTEPGIVWGAAKAATVLQRRRAEGKLDS